MQDQVLEYIKPMPKTVGKHFVLYVLLPFLAILFLVLYVIVYRCLLKFVLCGCLIPCLCCRNSAKLKDQ